MFLFELAGDLFFVQMADGSIGHSLWACFPSVFVHVITFCDACVPGRAFESVKKNRF